MDIRQLALTLAHNVAPDGNVQKEFTAIFHACESDGIDPTLPILSGIMDGLRYGNWPGRLPTVIDSDRFCTCGAESDMTYHSTTCALLQ